MRLRQHCCSFAVLLVTHVHGKSFHASQASHCCFLRCCRATAAALATPARRTTAGGGCAHPHPHHHPHLHPPPAPTRCSLGVNVGAAPVLALPQRAPAMMHLGATSAAPQDMLVSGMESGESLALKTAVSAACFRMNRHMSVFVYRAQYHGGHHIHTLAPVGNLRKAFQSAAPHNAGCWFVTGSKALLLAHPASCLRKVLLQSADLPAHLRDHYRSQSMFWTCLLCCPSFRNSPS